MERQKKLKFGQSVRILEIFCGCGGTSLGFKLAFQQIGLECEIVGIDLDHDACITFQRNNVGQAIRADARYPPIHMKESFFDIVIGCPPCQGFTKMRGKPKPTDPRNALVLTFLEWIRKLKPTGVFFENVVWIKTSDQLASLLSGLEYLKYEYAYGELDAADFGVPQRRRRFILIASMKQTPQLPAPTHASPDIAQRSGLPKWLVVRDGIGNLPPIGSGVKHPTIANHRAMKHSKKVLERIRHIPKNGGSRSSLPSRLHLACHTRRKGHNDVYGRMSWEEVAPTLTCGCTNPSKGRFIHPEQDRGITPREAARLQTFPDLFVFFGGFISTSWLIGNAMPVQFASRVATSVLRSCTLPD